MENAALKRRSSDQSISWKWLVGVLISLVLILGGIVTSDNKTLVEKNQVRIDRLADLKLDKEVYFRDMVDIRDMLKRIDIKLDKLRR